MIVGGSPEKRGVVAVANYVARKYGVHRAMPAATAIGSALKESSCGHGSATTLKFLVGSGKSSGGSRPSSSLWRWTKPSWT